MDTPKRNISTAILLAVASSQLNAIGYTPSDEVLTIQFPTKGDRPGGVYQYAGVKQETFDAFNAAESKGSFFGQHIKGRERGIPLYQYILLTPEEVAEHITLPTLPREVETITKDDVGDASAALSPQEPAQESQAA